MPDAGRERHRSLGYEFAREHEARDQAAALERRYTSEEMPGLRVYRVRWNSNYLVEATFAEDISDSRVNDARALLGESGTPVHPDDLLDYKRASEEGGTPAWFRRFFGG